jgi:hypothetical protein
MYSVQSSIWGQLSYYLWEGDSFTENARSLQHLKLDSSIWGQLSYYLWGCCVGVLPEVT